VWCRSGFDRDRRSDVAVAVFVRRAGEPNGERAKAKRRYG
jgi:hypothetical protein